MENSRQESLDLNTEVSVAVIGVGGVGSWAALALYKAGIRRLRLFDADVVEESNLHRTPFSKQDVGLYKVVAMKRMCEFSSRVQIFPAWENDSTGGYFLDDYTICCVDNLKVRRAVKRAREQSGSIYIDAAANGHSGNINAKPATFDLSPATTGYEVVPQWVGPQLFAALMAVSCVLYGLSPKWALYKKGELHV